MSSHRKVAFIATAALLGSWALGACKTGGGTSAQDDFLGDVKKMGFTPVGKVRTEKDTVTLGMSLMAAIQGTPKPNPPAPPAKAPKAKTDTDTDADISESQAKPTPVKTPSSKPATKAPTSAPTKAPTSTPSSKTSGNSSKDSKTTIYELDVKVPRWSSRCLVELERVQNAPVELKKGKRDIEKYRVDEVTDRNKQSHDVADPSYNMTLDAVIKYLRTNPDIVALDC